MRVAYVVSRFPSPTETFVAREMNELAKLGIDIDLYTLIYQGDALVHPESQPWMGSVRRTGVRHPELWKAQVTWLKRAPLRYLQTWASVIWGNKRSPKFLSRALVATPHAAWFALQAQEAGTDHIHAHWATHSALAAYVMHRLTGIPFSFTAHAHDLYVNRTMLSEKANAANFIATISEFNRKYLREHVGPTAADKTIVVRCGIDPEQFLPETNHGSGNVLDIVCVASLEPYKGHRVLLRGLSELRAAGVEFTCELIGDGPERADLETLTSTFSLSDAVTFAGHKDSSYVRERVARADVMALTSVVTETGKMEGIPVALMEAMALERVVVVSDISGISELVIEGTTGRLFDAGDASGFARVLQEIVNDPEGARTIGKNAREHVIDEFAAAPNAEKLRAAFVTMPG